MRFEPLNSNHCLKQFNCGETKINHFLKSNALSWQQENLTSCKVLIKNEKVIGFFTLSPSSIKKKYFPKAKLVEYPNDVPIILLGMMGVDKLQKGKGIGSIILTEALLWSYKLHTESELNFKALGVDALNEKSATFFTYQGFERIPNTNKLFISIENIINNLKSERVI